MDFENATLENIDFTKAQEVAGINFENATLVDVIMPELSENLEVV